MRFGWEELFKHSLSLIAKIQMILFFSVKQKYTKPHEINKNVNDCVCVLVLYSFTEKRMRRTLEIKNYFNIIPFRSFLFGRKEEINGEFLYYESQSSFSRGISVLMAHIFCSTLKLLKNSRKVCTSIYSPFTDSHTQHYQLKMGPTRENEREFLLL